MIATENPDELRRSLHAARRDGLRIGLVPTMGALHAGHLSLVQAARSECGFVCVSVFVNPAQFGPDEDFRRYPRPVEDDVAVCGEAGVDCVFHPSVETVYPSDFRTFVDVEGISTQWEGRFRPGHFRGVATVVLKLLHLVQPDVAWFGQKDYQQQLLVRKMCRDLNVPVEIRTCPTVREPDGLALSSRNAYLIASERQAALSLSQSLEQARHRLLAGETDVAAIRQEMLEHLNRTSGVAVDYATVTDAETLVELTEPRPRMVALVAARVGATRLIDNMTISLDSQ